MKRFAILSPSSVYPAELVAMMYEYGFKKEQVDLIDFKSLDKKYLFGDDVISVSNAKGYDFNNCNAVVIADDVNLSSSFMDKVKSYNIKIIIHSHIFGTDIKPSMADFGKNNDDKIISIPYHISIQAILALLPLIDLSPIKSISLNTYQSVSELNTEAMDELYFQTKKIFEAGSLDPKIFSKSIAFNCIPQVGEITSNRSTNIENQISFDVSSMLGINDISVSCVFVPVFNSSLVSMNVEFENDINIESVINAFESDEEINILDDIDESKIITQIESTKFPILNIFRVRVLSKNKISLMVTCDNRQISSLEIMKILQDL
jgi:aspartate-semialdehyde dehydrogenase